MKTDWLENWQSPCAGAARQRGATMRRLWRVMTHRTGADMINRIEFLSAWGER